MENIIWYFGDKLSQYERNFWGELLQGKQATFSTTGLHFMLRVYPRPFLRSYKGNEKYQIKRICLKGLKFDRFGRIAGNRESKNSKFF